MPKRNIRLEFTEEERQNPSLKKPIRKAEKAADKLDKTKAKLPTKINGQEKKPPSKLVHITADTPIDVKQRNPTIPPQKPWMPESVLCRRCARCRTTKN